MRFLLFLLFSLSLTAKSSELELVSNSASYKEAVASCNAIDKRLPTKKEILDAYIAETKAKVSSTGSSYVSSETWKHGTGFFWTQEKSWSMDAYVILSPIFVVPYPAKVPHALTVYYYKTKNEYTAYHTTRRPQLDGKEARVLCI